jgi:succinyl-diaminopimelate desuccinylase
LQGGSNFNVVPDTASFTIDRRTNPEEDLRAERDRIEEIVDSYRNEGIDIDIETFQYGEASASSVDDSLAQNLSGAIAEVVGEKPRFEMCPGLLEIRFYVGLGLPAFAYGPGSLAVAHQANEFVDLDEVDRTALVYALTASRHLAQR